MLILRQVRDRLNRDHQISGFVNRIQEQSERLRDVYADASGERTKEIQSIGTGDPFTEFYKQLGELKDFQKRYPNEPVENLERAYRKKVPGENDALGSEVDNMFSGEESYGRYLDMTTLHDDYLNLTGVKGGGQRLTYLQYLDHFDVFTSPQCPVKRSQKLSDDYFRYVGAIASYLESFKRRTAPLEDVDTLLKAFDDEFETLWLEEEIPGWEGEREQEQKSQAPVDDIDDDLYCSACAKKFSNQSVFDGHLKGKKHQKAAAAKNPSDDADLVNGQPNGTSTPVQRMKERAVAEREFRVRKIASILQTARGDTKTNIERRQGMTERERQQEREALLAENAEPTGKEEGSDDDGDDKIYNPLKLPLAWDGKPIPFWLYKLHGLGVEFPCEICGNFIYMGRRAFDKHFNEPRHTWGLRALGIKNTSLFREVTRINEALQLHEKIQRDEKSVKTKGDNIVEMEDGEGHVMPEKVYYDLQKQGLV